MAKKKETENRHRGDVVAADFAVMVNKSRRTIDEWIRKGCPVKEKGGRGKPYVLNIGDVMDWYIGEVVASVKGGDVADADALRRRKLAAQVEAAEMENARKRGELISIEDVVKVVAAEYASVRAKLLAIPAALAGALEGLNIGQRRTRLEQSITEALTELGSSGPLTGGPGDSESRKPKAPARTNGKRVGR